MSFGVRLDMNKILNLDTDVLGVSIGLGLFVPFGEAFRWNVIGGERLQWPMYLDRNQRMSILPAFALHILGVVAVGVGFRTSIDIEANTEFVVTQEEPEAGESAALTGQLGNQSRIAGKISPTFSVLATPADWIRLGAVVRLPVVSDDWGYTDIDTTRLPGIGLGSLSYTHRFAHYASPLEVAFGVAVAPIPSLLISVDGAYEDWSGYLDSNHQNYEGSPFRSIVTGRVGAEVTVHPSTVVLAGYGYVPSPFDNRGGWTNFVDNDRHLLSLGGQIDLMKALCLDRAPVRLGVHTQLQVLREHQEVKDWRAFRNEAEANANPGWPGWRSSGWVFNMGVSLDAAF
jgi:long-subunit fatty acid transport protein